MENDRSCRRADTASCTAGQRRAGLAAREVLALLVILVVALGLLLPLIRSQRGKSRRELCAYRQMSLARAMHRYEYVHGQFPGYRTWQTGRDRVDSPLVGWAFDVLPYVGLRYDVEDRGYRVASDTRRGPFAEIQQRYGPQASPALAKQLPSVYIPDLVCPADPPGHLQGSAATQASCSFVINAGLPDAPHGDLSGGFPPDWPANGLFLDPVHSSPSTMAQVNLSYLERHDGAGNTLMLSENLDSGLWTAGEEPLLAFLWGVPGDPQLDRGILGMNQRRGEGPPEGAVRFARPSSWHAGGVTVAYADGKTDFMSEDIDPVVFSYLMTADGTNLRYPGSDRPLTITK